MVGHQVEGHQSTDAGLLVVERPWNLLSNLAVDLWGNAGRHHHRVALMQAAHDLNDVIHSFTGPPNDFGKSGAQGAVVIDLSELFDGFKV